MIAAIISHTNGSVWEPGEKKFSFSKINRLLWNGWFFTGIDRFDQAIEEIESNIPKGDKINCEIIDVEIE